MRVGLSGDAEPNPVFALPEPGVSSSVPPLVLSLGTGSFAPGTYLDLGYDYYEVWCVGAAGGRGGSILEIQNTQSQEWYGAQTLKVRTFGGEGGGGGLHRVNGLLAALPADTPVVVGQAGADGADGNQHMRWKVATAMQDFAGVPTMLAVVKGATNIPGMVDGAGNAIPPYFYSPDSPYLYYNNPYYAAPQDAQDGGASTFGAVGKASGGIGGRKTPVYRDDMGVNTPAAAAIHHGPGGAGGAGGIGGRTAAGGGGAGATSTTAAVDGNWIGIIGKGGGGGAGGTFSDFYDNRFPTQDQTVTIEGKSGANGSFSYGDTSVYGPRGLVGAYPVPIHFQGQPDTRDIVPGFGGGANALSSLKYGGKVTGYSPNGLVVIRLMRVN